MSQLIPISLLSQYAYCPRSAWLYYNTGAFKENQYTVDGELVHRRVHTAGTDQREGRKQLRRVSLYSRRLGLIGYADLIEQEGDAYYPVEFKRGTARQRTSYEVQLCAQALCLEEMTRKDVPVGYLYYYASHQRMEVPLDVALRNLTTRSIHELRDLLSSERAPAASPSPRCKGCAQADACLASVDRVLSDFSWEDWQ
jgi:CRISPR-associated exonuclease Cas4